MRTVKYRGIGLDTGKWVYGYSCFDSTKENAAIINKHGNNEMQHNAVIPETVGEFTGLTDDNDKEIYEGDIIQFMSISVDKPVVVEWNDDICQFQFSDGQPINSGDTYGVYKAVIGNIHENPELLNQ